jgi:hypothetical protein
MKNRSTRNGFTFIELLIGAAILGGAFIAFVGVVDAASKRVHDATARHLAELYARNVTARYQHVRPQDLARIFGRGEGSAKVLGRDPILAAATPGGTAAARVAYRSAPGLMRVGRLVTTVDYDTTRGPAEVVHAPLVHGRKLPALPPVSLEIASGSSPVERENFALAIALEAKPDDPMSRALLPAMALEARHGRVLTPWSQLVRGAESAREVVDALDRGLGGRELPDGNWRVDWVQVGPLITPGARARRVTSILYLASRESERHWLPVKLEEDADGRVSTWVGGAPARDFGEVAVGTARGEGGLAAAAPGTTAHLRATAKRAFALAPRLSANGQARGLEPLLTVVTFAHGLSAAGNVPARDTLADIAAALAPGGLALTLAPKPAADDW